MEELFFKFSNLSKYPEIIHGMSTRAYGNMKFDQNSDEAVEKNRKIFFKDLGIGAKKIVVASQSHGTKIVTVNNIGDNFDSTDGLVTNQKGIFLMIIIGDCLPVMIYDPLNQIVGIIHAGWRGIINQIIPKAVGKFINLGSEPINLIIGVGPAICQKHFVVKDEVLKTFKDSYPQATFVRNHDGYVDLKKAVLLDLKYYKIPKHNIEISSDCPACSNGIYGSFRKEGNSAPMQVAVIGMR